MADVSDGGGVPLADMIETLRTELEDAQLRGAGRAISFGVEKVELELKVTVSQKAGGQAGIKFWVINAGAKAESSLASAHTFKLTLSPLDSATRERLNVASKSHTPVNKNEASSGS